MNSVRNISFITVLIAGIMLLSGCGSSSPLNGDPAEYSNAGESFTITLPSSGEDAWTAAEDSPDDTLDITDKSGAVNVYIKVMSKAKAGNVASDLSAFRDYMMTTVLSGIADSMNLSDETVTLPDFAADSISQKFTLKSGANSMKGDIIFMESDSSYYLCMITTTESVYSSSRKTLMESIAGLTETGTNQ